MPNTATSRIARISGAVVLPYFCRRLPGDEVYELIIDRPLEEFPTDDAEHDTRRLVAALEAHIRSCPEQYWWIHKRFKGRPPPYPDIYATQYVAAGPARALTPPPQARSLLSRALRGRARNPSAPSLRVGRSIARRDGHRLVCTARRAQAHRRSPRSRALGRGACARQGRHSARRALHAARGRRSHTRGFRSALQLHVPDAA